MKKSERAVDRARRSAPSQSFLLLSTGSGLDAARARTANGSCCLNFCGARVRLMLTEKLSDLQFYSMMIGILALALAGFIAFIVWQLRELAVDRGGFR